MKRIASLDDISEYELQVFRSGSKEFLVTRKGDAATACSNICPHHGARLCDGGLHDGVVTCPAHHARFDLSTGAALSPPAFDPLTVYETEIINRELFIGRPGGGGFPSVTPEESPCFVIIGGGAAGISCAERLRSRGFTGQVIVISDEESFPYDRTTLTTSFFSGEQGGLLLRDPEYFKIAGIDIRTGERVRSVDRGSKFVACDSGSRIRYDRLLVATGSMPRRLGVEGESLPGVYRLRSLKDAEALREVFDTRKPLLIIGGGFLALELSFTAASRGVPVTVAAPEALPLVRFFGKAYAKRVAGMLKAAGVDWLAAKSVREFSGKTNLEAVYFKDGSRIETSAAVVAVGAAPQVAIHGLEGLTGESGVRVGADFQTDDPEVFAAGDAADAHAGHWVTAMRQGIYAASSLLGDSDRISEVPFFWSDLGGETVRSVGTTGPPGGEPETERGAIQAGDFLAVWRSGSEVTGAFSVGYDRELIDVEHFLRTGRK